jgi:hypothetical protein
VIEQQDIHRAFFLWRFVDGVSVLLTDSKLTATRVPFDLVLMLEGIVGRGVAQDPEPCFEVSTARVALF